MGTGSVIPSWFTYDYIENMLKKHYKTEELTVKVFSSQPATKKGDNYASVLHRILVDFEKDGKVVNASFVVKIIPGGIAGEILIKEKLFDIEMQVYNEILPRVSQLLEAVNDFTKISPDCYHTTISPNESLVFEDLHVDNYELFEHGRLINLDHALLVLMKLAKLHAASAVIYEEDPELMDIFLEGPISPNPDRQGFLGFFTANMQSLAEEVAQWEGYEIIAGKLFGLVETIIPKAFELFVNEEGTFRVLTHGDLWIKNCMYRYNNGEPEDVVLVDYQLASFGSPAVDLNFFLYGSVNENVRKVHFKFMVQYYHCILKETLERLKYKGRIPTLKDIHIEIIKKSINAVIAAACLVPIIFVDPDRSTDMEGLIDESNKGKNSRKTNIENPKYKAYIQKVLKEFELSGFLE